MLAAFFSGLLLRRQLQALLHCRIWEIPAAIQAGRDPLDRFDRAVHAYARVIDRSRHAATLSYRESWSLNRDRLAEIVRREVATNRLIRDCVEACIQAGAFRPVDAEILTYQIVVFVHAWAHSAWRLGRDITVDAYVDRNLAALLAPVLAETR